MKSYLLLFTFFFLCAFIGICQTENETSTLVTENIPEITKQLTVRMNQYQSYREAFINGWSPDGSGMLIGTKFGETYQVHYIDHPRGERKQLTFFKDPVIYASYCPNKSFQGFMFFKDNNGDEFNQLYWFDLEHGDYTMISDGGQSMNSDLLWSENGDQFIYRSTRRNGVDFDLYLSNMQNPKESKLILSKGGGGVWNAIDWSIDGQKVIVKNYISANKSLLYVLDLHTGQLEEINTTDEDISYGQAVWSASNNDIFYFSDQGTEFLTLRFYDMSSKQNTEISESIKGDGFQIIFNKNRDAGIVAFTENGFDKCYTFDPTDKELNVIEGMPVGMIFPWEFHPDGKMFSLMINSPKSPTDVYTYDIESRKLLQWTYSEIGGLNNSAFTSPVVIEYETFDKVKDSKRKISALYYKSENKAGNKIPVMIDIHGGPEGQAFPTFSPFLSYLTNELGVAVIRPNVRGSRGYGKSFLKLDNGYKREDAVKDIGKLLDWISEQPELDASRVAVYGGSYGGYMVLASMVHYNSRLRCGIDYVGISNFVTFLQNTEEYRRNLRRAEYGDERDPEMYEFLQRISPTTNAEKITKPLFIVQGLNDPRVPASESEQMKDILRKNGNEVWYLLAKDEGHGFRKKVNRTYMELATVMFLKKYLLN